MIQVGKWNKLIVVKAVDFGLYLDGGEAGEILLPKRFVPRNVAAGATLDVFLYHDSENRLIATTEQPLVSLGEIALLKVVGVTQQGAFMDWGLMKDLFVPLSQQTTKMKIGGSYLIGVYQDERTGRLAGTERINQFLSKEPTQLKELEAVKLLIWRTTDIGYFCIINNQYTGVLHYDDAFQEYTSGDVLEGYIKNIREEGKIDVAPGKPGYARVEAAADTVLRLLDAHDGYLPFNDKSQPEEIYEFFGMSKKTFKMTTGGLYKSGQIEFTQTGIRKKEA